MTNIIILDELTIASAEVRDAIASLTAAIVKEKNSEIHDIAFKAEAVIKCTTPRGWEVFDATLAKGDMEGPQTWNTVEGYNGNGKTMIDVLAAITVPTSYEDVLEANVAFLTRKIELLKVILNNTETGYRKYEMSEELDKCESIEEMNEMILD